MASKTRQLVRFTGERTGLESIRIKGVGQILVGQEFEVSREEADRLTTLLPMRGGKTGSDFKKVDKGPASAEHKTPSETKEPKPSTDESSAAAPKASRWSERDWSVDPKAKDEKP